MVSYHKAHMACKISCSSSPQGQKTREWPDLMKHNQGYIPAKQKLKTAQQPRFLVSYLSIPAERQVLGIVRYIVVVLDVWVVWRRFCHCVVVFVALAAGPCLFALHVVARRCALFTQHLRQTIHSRLQHRNLLLLLKLSASAATTATLLHTCQRLD